MPTSFQDFLASMEGGAAERSRVEPWQTHLVNQRGGMPNIPIAGAVGLPQRGARRSGRASTGGVSPSELERLLDPRLTEGLQLARSQNQSAQELMRALGLEHDDGKPADGFLNRAFRAIDYPRALTFNAFRAMLDPDMDFSDFREAVDERQGFGELSGLQFQEDDSGLTRVWKGGAAFLGDVLTDPLMLVSFGALPAGKKLGSAAVQRAVASRARDLPEDILKRVADDALKAEARFGAQRAGADLSEEAVEQIARRFENIAPNELLGNMAAEAYQLRGATGLREFMQRYGDDASRLWDSLPTDMRGGLRIRVPFAREERVRKTIAIAGGGGQLAKAVGLGPLVSKSHQLRNMARSSQAATGMSRSINGFYGDLYSDMVGDLVMRGADNISGFSYAMWQHADKALRGAQTARKAINSTGQETMARVMYRLDTAGDPEDVESAWKAFNRYASDPAELDRLVPSTGLEVDELRRHFANLGSEALEMSESELLGLWAASEYHFLMRSLLTQARASGVDMGYLNDYLPLVLTEQKAGEIGAKKAGLARRAGRMSHGYDPGRERQMGFELRAVQDEDGVVRTVLQPLTPQQVNEKVRQRSAALGSEVSSTPFFEEDLGLMLDRYVGAIAHATSEAEFAQLIRRSGLVTEGDRELVPKLRNRTIGEAQETIDSALDLLRQIETTGEHGNQLRQAIHAILDDSDTLRTTIHRAVNDPTLTPEQQVDAAGDVMRVLDTWLDRLPSAGEADKLLAQARRQFQKSIRQTREAARDEVVAGPTSRALTELGMTPVNMAEFPIRKVPPELDAAFAPEALTSAIHKFYKLRGAPAKDLVDRWYRPYHAMFKMTATIGRGPGFHIRNAWGGTINNMLYGATPEDAMMMSRVVKRMMSASRQARKEVAQETRQAGAAVKQTRGFDEMVNTRAEEIMQRTLRELKITDDMDGWQFYRAMIDQEDILWGRKHGRGFEAFGLDGDDEVVGRIGMRRSERYPGRTYDELSPAQKGVEKLANFWWIRLNASAAEMTEAYLRGTAFLHGIRKYRDPEVARIGTLITQFDYQDLSHFERKWLRGTLLPFYTWTRNNIPFQSRMLMQNPGRMNIINRAVENAENAFGDDDIDVLPEWMKVRFGFVSRFQFGGNPLMFGVETPAQDLNEYFKVGSVGSSIEAMGRAFGSALNPAFSIPMQLTWGTEFFTGASLSETDQRLAPRWYQALPQSIAPTWIDPKTGDVMGDARLIMAGPGAFPWLGQSEKVISIMSALGGSETAYPEGRNRLASDVIRQFFPVVTAGTLTAQGEAGELFQRTRRLRSQAARQADPEDYAMVRQLQQAGYSLEEIAHIMEAHRARREQGL